MNKIRIIYKYLLHFFSARNTGGFGVHSPYLYNFTRFVLRENHPFYSFEQIEQRRSLLLKDLEKLNINDFGTGLRRKDSIANIARKSLKSPKQAQLLFRIVNHIKAQNVLEFGTSLGITSSYLAISSKRLHCVTLEGDVEIAEVAQNNFDYLGIKNIDLIVGNIDDILTDILNKFERLDFVFFDANHRSSAVLNYFDKCLLKVHKNTVFVIDDLYWSGDMEYAWESIKSNKAVTSTIDLFYMGIVFFNPDFHKRHYKMRF